MGEGKDIFWGGEKLHLQGEACMLSDDEARGDSKALSDCGPIRHIPLSLHSKLLRCHSIPLGVLLCCSGWSMTKGSGISRYKLCVEGT